MARSSASSARERRREPSAEGTNKVTSKRRKQPGAASLLALPPIDFARYQVLRNPYAERVASTGIKIVHDDPSSESLAEIPEADLSAITPRRNPYAARAAEAVAKMQYGKGRPRRGREVGPTPARSIRLPQVVWDALEVEARRSGTTVHALLRQAVAAYLER